MAQGIRYIKQNPNWSRFTASDLGDLGHRSTSSTLEAPPAGRRLQGSSPRNHFAEYLATSRPLVSHPL